MLPSETMIWQPEFTDKILSRKPGAVQFVEMYQQSEGWYLLPPWHFMNMAQACMLAFGMCLVLLVIMSGAWALKIIRG